VVLCWSSRLEASIAHSKLNPTPIFLSRAVQIGIDAWNAFRALTNYRTEAAPFAIGEKRSLPSIAISGGSFRRVYRAYMRCDHVPTVRETNPGLHLTADFTGLIGTIR
jgi:hypothetical protein